jgi:phage terminase large subunit-like protein
VDPERPHLELVQVWQPDAGDQVPIGAVEDALREACRRWEVLEIAADPYRWARSLQILAGEGLPVLEFPQTTARMTPATSAFEQAVLNGRLSHSGDKTLAEHIGNAVIKDDGRGARLSKPAKHSPRRIDAAVAAVMAYSRAAYLAESTGVSLYAFDLEG